MRTEASFSVSVFVVVVFVVITFAFADLVFVFIFDEVMICNSRYTFHLRYNKQTEEGVLHGYSNRAK